MYIKLSQSRMVAETLEWTCSHRIIPILFIEKIANNEVDPKAIYDMKEKLGSG